MEERLDRFFASPEWILQCPEAVVSHVLKQSSDHNLLLLHTQPPKPKHKPRFYFDQRWTQREGFAGVVQQAWAQQSFGSSMYQVLCKIKQCRIAIIKWKNKASTNSAVQI